MKLLITLALLFTFSTSFSQWTRVEQLPSTNIFTLFHKASDFYAGGTNVIYKSHNKGQTWDSTTAIPGLSQVSSIISSIIVYKNELYAGVPSKGVFKSADDGTTWQNVSNGIFPEVTDLCEFRGDLYAATEGNFAAPIFKLDPVTKTHWLSFSNGLNGISTVLTSITGTSNTLIAGANNNGLYDYLAPNSTTWEERFLLDQISPNEGAFDIITAHDTLFYAGKSGKFYMSTDNGLNWNLFGNRLVTGATFIVNANEALISSRYVFTNVNNTLFYYIKKDSLQDPFQNFSIVANHFTWKIDILGNKLWDASDQGLFFMSLSDLPGITAADDTLPIILPVHFTSFIANCDEGKVLLNWKTAQEQNSSHFDIERSVDGIHWTVIGNLQAAGNSNTEKNYVFTDNNPVQNNFYRITEDDLDGRSQNTNILRSSCSVKDIFSVWPNPVTDKVSVQIVTAGASVALIKLFDSKGALIKWQKTNLTPGSNQLSIDMKLLAKGMYLLNIDYDDGRNKKTAQLIKQ